MKCPFTRSRARGNWLRLPKVWLDKNKLKTGLRQHLHNAIHADGSCGPLTCARYARKMQPGDVGHDAGSRLASVPLGDTVSVAETGDTGAGIPEHQLAKIFDPFFTRNRREGHGFRIDGHEKKSIRLHGGTNHDRNPPSAASK